MSTLPTLTTAQQRVVDLMRAGWELGASMSGIGGGPWLQKDGLGCGGECERVNGNTYSALLSKGVIKTQEARFPTRVLRLSKEWLT